ncbi:MAG TPA: hypothetical protein VGL74_01360 [Terriglobales bacterium]|jgi:hypothetical protein
MKTRTGQGATSLRHALVAIIAIASISISACNSRSASKKLQDNSVASASEESGAHIDVMCIADRINNPPEAFHYSYKYTTAANSLNEDADITPQAMDITIGDGSGSHSYHGVRSDEASWNSAVLDLSSLSLTAMSARMNSLNGSAVVHNGLETVNGYNTTKYTIDTTSANSSDQQQFETLFGKSSFDKGTVWIGPDDCAVRLLLDEGLWQQDGSIKKTHWEISRIKK